MGLSEGDFGSVFLTLLASYADDLDTILLSINIVIRHRLPDIMLTSEALQKLSTVPTASWAIWSLNGASDIAFFTAKMELLHARVVILGLNRGRRALGQETILFVNFHTPKHRGDKRLERFIQGNQLEAILGGYMTDLSLEIETDSKKVEIDKPTVAVDNLRSQLSFSDEPRRTIICIGDKTFDTLCRGIGLKASRYKKDQDNLNLRMTQASFEGEEWSVYRVWLHSSYGKFEHYGEVELPKQLTFINDQVHGSGPRR